MGKGWAVDDCAQLHKDANAALDANLAPGETVTVTIRGIQNSAFIGTDRRLFVFKKSLWDKKLMTWDYSGISGVEYHDKGPLMPAYVRLNAVGADGKMAHGSDNALQIYFADKSAASAGVAELRRAISAHQKPMFGSAQVTDVADQIRKLADLRDAGILTEDEFQTKKRTLLGV